MGNNIIYFKNLNGLRFIAAFAVIIHHIEQLKSFSSIPNYWSNVPFIGLVGKLGVVLFFVLSGFLITYLLLVEEKKFNEIDIKKFYLRRILRIWPLYFLIIILAIFILPQIDFFVLPNFPAEIVYADIWQKLLLYLIMLPNLVLTYFGPIPYASQTWSIGTEEQFYLIWPLLMAYFRKNRYLLMVSTIFLYIFIKLILSLSILNFIPLKGEFREFWSTFTISCMAIGGILAVLLFNESKLLKFIINVRLFFLVLVILTFLIAFGIHIPVIHYEFYGGLFGILILNLAVNNEIPFSLENRVFNYLGRISYGLYMFHTIAITISLKLAINLNLTNNYFIIPVTLLITVVLSHFSFTYFEAYFLKFKNKFVKVPSGNESKKEVIDSI